MDGIHDMGGMHGFGKVEHSPKEPVFASEWEGRIFAMFLSLNGVGLIGTDEFRHSMERMNPAEYLSSSYYEHWFHGVVQLLDEKGVVSAGDLAARAAAIGRAESCR